MDDLERLLRERGLTDSLNDFRRARETSDVGTQLEAWKEKYISEDTLLSADELNLWRKIRTRKETPLGANSRPVANIDVQTAIASLQSSTAAIEKQQKVLESQKAALQALRRHNVLGGSENGAFERSDSETNHISIITEQLQQSLKEDFSAISDHTVSTIRSVLSYASERLDADDKSLEAITRLQLSGHVNVHEPDAKLVDHWCRSLVSYRTAVVTAAIAETYNHELEQAGPGASRTTADDAEQREQHALQAELDSLRAEISSVSEMVVDHEFRKPITLSITSLQVKRAESLQEWYDFVLSSLRYVTNRADTLCRHASELRGFQSALTEMQEVFANETRQVIQEDGPVPKLERSTSGLRPLLLGRSASGTLDPDQPVRLLRMLDADVEVEKNGMNRSQLQAVLQSRLARAEKQRLAAEMSNLQLLCEHLGHEKAEADAVLDALFTNTRFNEKSLSDLTVERKMDDVEGAIDHAGHGISAVQKALDNPLPQGVQRLSLAHRK